MFFFKQNKSIQRKLEKLHSHCSSSLSVCHSTARKSPINPPAALLRHVLLNPSGDKVTHRRQKMTEKPPLLLLLLLLLLSCSSPGNIRETWTRLSLLSVSHATHKKPPVSPPQAAHAAKMTDNRELICPGGEKEKRKKILLAEVWHKQHNTVFVGCVETTSHHKQRVTGGRERSTHTDTHTPQHTLLYKPAACALTTPERAMPPGRSLVQGWAAGARPDVSCDLH